MKKRLLLCLFGVASVVGTAFAQGGGFRHPGLLHSEEDFRKIKERIAAGDAQTLAALDVLKNAPGVRGNWGGDWAINEHISRGISGQENYMNAYRNAARAYQLALLWKITGDTGYGDAAKNLLNGYRIWNKSLGGNTNMSLIPGFIGYQFCNAAEIMRDYPGWPAEEFELFKQYMIDVWFTLAQDFLERRHDTVTREENWYHYHSNWGAGNALFCVSLGVLCDLPDIYNYGMYWFKEGPGNESTRVSSYSAAAFGQGLCGYGWGLMPWFHQDERGPLGYFAQMQESGRDQGHAMAGLGLASYTLQTAYNQGDNAYCNLNNSRLSGKVGSTMMAAAAEYVAAYNAGVDDLPYTTNWWMGALNATGRGQWRPIWQLFINHYQNRMGIPMTYCSQMKNIIGIEGGGGAYGTNSGAYDHTGFGDLMHYDEPVGEDEVPTILYPQILMNGGQTVHRYAEAGVVTDGGTTVNNRPVRGNGFTGVEPGTVLMLAVDLPEGEANTGQWEWEDGATGQNRQITADHSGIYRVTYTNSKGVKSTQMFSVAVRGEGIMATHTCTANYCGRVIEGDDVEMGLGRTLSVTSGYANWNYVESETWYDENGTAIGTGGSYNYTLRDRQEHKLTYRLVNQSGVVIEKVFNIKPYENDRTDLLSDPNCNNVSLWNTDVEGFAVGTASYPGFSGAFIERQRAATASGMSCWGQEPFDISETLTGLPAGKYELSASVIATQQSLTGAAGKDFVKDIYLYGGGANAAVSSQDGVPEFFTVDFYVGEDGEAKLGLKNVTNQNRGNSANGANWVAMDNYTLVYKGTDDLSADLAEMRGQAAAANAGEMTPALYETLKELAGQTSVDIASAVALERALGDARMLAVHYTDYMAVYQQYKDFVERGNVTHAGLLAALDAFAGAVTADEFFTAYEDMEAAWSDFLCEAELPVDMTSALLNTALATTGTDNIGWKTDAGGGNFQVLAVDGSDTQRGDAVAANMIERWCTANFAVGERLIYQDVIGMPSGRFVFRAAAQKGREEGAVELFANKDGEPVMSPAVLRGCAVSTIVTDGKLSVGIRSAEANACQWVSMTDFVLEYHSPVMLLNEALEEAAALDYGTDKDNALQAAVSAARTALAGGTASERLGTYDELLEAIGQYKIQNASEEHPVDMTAYVRNGDFRKRTLTGWTYRSSVSSAYCQGAMEVYHAVFDMSQTVTGLPTGNYRFSMQARSDAGTSNRSLCIYVKDANGDPITAYAADKARADGANNSLHLGQNAADFSADADASRISVETLSAGGELTLGAACDRADMWCVMGGLKLEYLGLEDTELADTWHEQVKVANEMDRSAMTFAVDSLLKDAVDVDITQIDTDSLAVALANLMKQIRNAREVMPQYAGLLSLMRDVEEIIENSETSAEVLRTYLQSTLASVSDEVDAASTPEEIEVLYNSLESGRQTYVTDAVPLNGIGFDLTFKVANASGTQAGGWLTDGTGNFFPVTDAAVDGEYSGTYFEKWDIESYVFKGTRPIYQTLSNLKGGRYVLTAAAFRMNEFGGAVPAGSISLYANNDKVEVASDKLDYYELETVVTTQTLELGLVSGTVNTANRVGLADVKLMFYGPQKTVLDENDEVLTVENGTTGDITLVQSWRKDHWNVVCLPVDLRTSVAVRKYFTAVKSLSKVEMDGEVCNLYFVNSTRARTGIPYLVQVAEDVDETVFTNMTLDTEAYLSNSVTVTDGTVTAKMQGTCQVTSLDVGAYVFENDGVRKAEAGETVKGFRAFLEIDGATPELVNLYIDGELVTSVHDVWSDAPDKPVDVYTVNGQKVKASVKKSDALQGLPKGIYIVDGKKMIK